MEPPSYRCRNVALGAVRCPRRPEVPRLFIFYRSYVNVDADSATEGVRELESRPTCKIVADRIFKGDAVPFRQFEIEWTSR
jgi:hypothetical protein